MTGIKKMHGDFGILVGAAMQTRSQNPHPVAQNATRMGHPRDL